MKHSYILTILTTVLIYAFADHNGNGVMDDGETYAAGRYAVHRAAGDGAVSVFFVNYPPGVPYRMDPEPDGYTEAHSGCGAWPVAGEVVHVSVMCGAVFAPMVGGGQ